MTEPAPRRPRQHDADVVRAVAEDMTAEFADWCEEKPGPEHTEMLVKALSWGGHNGYAIAKRLESQAYIEPDALLVELLDGAAWWRHERAAVIAWVSANNITIPHQIGDEVTTRHGVGVVTKINSAEATLYVRTPEQAETSAWIVAVEDSSAVEPVT